MSGTKCLAVVLLAACAAPPLERFPSTANERIPGSRSQLSVPEGAGRHPAIVMLHTCGGIGPHLDFWAKRFVDTGYVVLKVDSFGPRGEGLVCGPWTASVDQVAADALAAAEHLRKLPLVDANRIAAVGFSYGAMAVLRLGSPTFVKRWGGRTRFRALVAFYPSCDPPLGQASQFAAISGNSRFDNATPVHLFLGEADREAPSGSCVSHAEARKREGQPFSYTLFPDATHAFDVDDSPQGHAYNAQAVDAAWEEMREFLARQMR